MELVGRLKHAAWLVQRQSLAEVFSRASGWWHRAFNPEGKLPACARAALIRRMRKMFERDAQNAASGYYPDSLLSFPLREYLPVMAEALSDAPRMWWIRQRSEFALDAEPDRYPPYYRRRFHWQPDGWLSDHSARVYDVEVEFLFWGCADIIRRMAIPPLVDGLRGRARPRVLDVGCGTGRFLRMLEVALPEARLYGVDLSPHYAARARREAKSASILVENAEELPFDSGSFDAVASVFVFHELPHAVRRRVTAEAYRVLKAGGCFVVCDSAQRGDDPTGETDPFLDWFPSTYHEPYYRGYVRDRLEDLLATRGFSVERSEAHALSKVVLGVKRRAA